MIIDGRVRATRPSVYRAPPVRTLIISDLHLGNRGAQRRAAAARAARAPAGGAGRHRPARAARRHGRADDAPARAGAMAIAEPVLREIGRRLGPDREVILVPGQPRRPAGSRVGARARARGSGSTSVVDPRRQPGAGAGHVVAGAGAGHASTTRASGSTIGCGRPTAITWIATCCPSRRSGCPAVGCATDRAAARRAADRIRARRAGARRRSPLARGPAGAAGGPAGGHRAGGGAPSCCARATMPRVPVLMMTAHLRAADGRG